tara:strand:- start:3633 stop:4076 length:444 start_codon:yes stop_codon:yes gene_type:complete
MANELLTTGYDGVLSFVSGTISGAPTSASLVEITHARDTDLKINVDKVEISDRSSRYKLYCPSMIELEITTTVSYTAATKPFIDRVLDRNEGTVALLDKTGGEGIYFHCQVFSSDYSASLTSDQNISLSFCPTRSVDFASNEAPVWA